MKLIAGLGNPGPKYELTRHNIGFIILDFFAADCGIRMKEGKGDWAEGNGPVNGEHVLLLKPLTYMNNSGTAVREFAESNEINLKDILVISDDFQIPLGTVRVRKRGSDGGHNGLASIIYHLNSDEFPRMRIGIGPEELLKGDDYIEFVLGNFTKGEIDILRKLMPEYLNCIRSFITHGATVTMNKFNRSFL